MYIYVYFHVHIFITIVITCLRMHMVCHVFSHCRYSCMWYYGELSRVQNFVDWADNQIS